MGGRVATTEPELHWLCNSPSPYNARLFGAIERDSGLRLLVHYRHLSLGTHPWQTQLASGYRYRAYKSVLGLDWTLVRLALSRRSRLDSCWFIIAGWDHPTAWMLLLLFGLRRAKYLIWTDAPDIGRERKGWRDGIRQTFLRWAFRRARYVMGTGRPTLSALKAMGAPAGKLVNFPYWIDLDLYTPRSPVPGNDDDADGPLVCVSLGLVLNRRKGHDIAVRAIAAAAAECPGPFEYRIIGIGPDEQRLRHLAEGLGIGDRVKLLGWQEPGEVRRLLQQADIFIHPSPTHEPYGVAVLEAMATGLPVLASDRTCAALDRVEPGVSGFIHEAANIGQLASHLSDLLNDESRREWMGGNALATARQWPLSRGVQQIRQLVVSEGAIVSVDGVES